MFWRKLSLNDKDRIIVFGGHLHSVNEYDHILFSQFSQYEFALQAAGNAQITLKETNDSYVAINRLFLIKSSWMDSVYSRMKKTALQTCVVNAFQSLHHRLYAARHSTSKIFHETCLQFESIESYAQAVVGELTKYRQEIDDIREELLAIDDGITLTFATEMIRMIKSKCNIYANVHKFHDALWKLMANEIVQKYHAQFGDFGTLHVIMYYKRAPGFIRMENMICKSIANLSMGVFP